jgi:CelD/BcsL family acetyltransferase involved in cellulose biosynthesis
VGGRGDAGAVGSEAGAEAVEILHSFEPLEAEWDALADRAGSIPWVRPGWVAAWWRAFGEGRPTIVTLRRDGELAGVLPLAGGRRGALRSPTNWHTPEFELLAVDDAARAALARAVLAQLRPRRLTLAFLPAEGGGLEEVRAAARTARYRVLERELERSPYVPVEGSWEAFAAGLTKKVEKDVNRRTRRLEERGPVELEVLDGGEDLDALLEEGFRLEGSGWKDENGTAISSRPDTLGFYTEVARWAAARGTLRLVFLKVAGARIAFELVVAEDGRWYDLKGGYDAEERQHSPGKLTARRLLERLHVEGARSLELLGKEEPWKLELTSAARSRRLLQAFSPRPGGIADWLAFRFGRPAAKAALARVRR